MYDASLAIATGFIGLNLGQHFPTSGNHFHRWPHYLYIVKFEFGPAIEAWLRVAYPRGCWSVRGIRGHQARLYVTNYDKPLRCFDCNALWWTLFAPCWLISAPFYKVTRTRNSLCIDYIVAFCQIWLIVSWEPESVFLLHWVNNNNNNTNSKISNIDNAINGVVKCLRGSDWFARLVNEIILHICDTACCSYCIVKLQSHLK